MPATVMFDADTCTIYLHGVHVLLFGALQALSGLAQSFWVLCKTRKAWQHFP